MDSTPFDYYAYTYFVLDVALDKITHCSRPKIFQRTYINAGKLIQSDDDSFFSLAYTSKDLVNL